MIDFRTISPPDFDSASHTDPSGRPKRTDRYAAHRRLRVLNGQARRVVEQLSDRERAMVLMRGAFGGRLRSLSDVARAFIVSSRHVREVELGVFGALGQDWHWEWTQAREATRHLRAAPLQREREHAFCCKGPRPRARRGATNGRRRGSRRGVTTSATRTSRGDPDDLGDEPPGSRRPSSGGRR